MDKIKKISRDRFEWLMKQHYKLWDWLVKNPDKHKSEWEGFEYCEPVSNNCFVCQFENDLFELNDDDSIFQYECCTYCPCKDIGCDSGLYESWSRSNNKYTKAKLAKQIRDLEWSGKYVEGIENEVYREKRI